MMPDVSWRRLVPAFVLVLAAALSCRHASKTTRPYSEPPPPGLEPTVIPYADTDAFDAFFETALVNRSPVILIQTDTAKPDWGPRLNAWIAAWNRGGPSRPPNVRADEPASADTPATVRMQAPLPVNGETVRELRLLIDDLMTRVEDLARRGSTWWAEERTQKRRIILLRPYSLRFHLDEAGDIQLIFFNGMYAPYYRRFMASMAAAEGEAMEEWVRAVQCSRCKEKPKVRSGSP